MFSPIRKGFAPLSSLLSFTLVAALPSLITGCALTSTATNTDQTESTATITGHMYGGQQPVTGSTVSLYVVGLTGYGSSPASGTALATTTTDGNGNFSLGTYTCPSGANQIVYLETTGGVSQTGQPSNTAIKMMAVLGGPAASGSLVTTSICGTVKTNAANIFVNVDEISTIVAVNAMAQFFNPRTEFFGTSSTNAAGLTNAVNIAGSMMNISGGMVNATYSPVGATINGSTTNVTATPEVDKINYIADIIAACVNSSGPGSSPCMTLMSSAVPPPAGAKTTPGGAYSYPAATDTLQAAYYLAVNPTNATTAGTPNTTNTSNLYTLASPVSPFPSSTPQPTDWGIGVTYSSLTTANATISAPLNLSVDGSGNVYYINTTSAAPMGSDIGELNPYGGLAAAGLTSFVTLSSGLTIDPNSLTYVGRPSNKTTYSYKPTATSFAALVEDASLTNLTFLPSQFAADGTALFSTSNSTSNPGSIFQVPYQGQTSTPFTSATATTLSTYPVNNGHAITGLTNSSPIVADQASNLWTVAGNAVYKVPYTAYPSAGATGTAGSTPVSVAGTFNAPDALAVDHSNNVWIANTAGGSPASGYVSYTTTAGAVTSDSVSADGGIANPAGVAIDGAGNVWVASAGTGTGFTGETVSELALVTSTITPFSPSVGFAHTYNKPGSIAIDASGNVWVANVGNYESSTVPGTVTVILGAASPAVTPLSLGIKNGTLAALP